MFDATLGLRRTGLSPAALARVTARYPAATLRMLLLIYLQAITMDDRAYEVEKASKSSSAPTSSRTAACRRTR